MPGESDLRRDDFLPGIPVVLADGAAWTMPGPPPWPATAVADPRHATFAAEYAANVAMVMEAEDEAERCRAELALAIVLLGRNYRLGPAEYRVALAPEPGSPAAAALAVRLREAAEPHVDRARAAPCPAPHEAVESKPHLGAGLVIP